MSDRLHFEREGLLRARGVLAYQVWAWVDRRGIVAHWSFLGAADAPAWANLLAEAVYARGFYRSVWVIWDSQGEGLVLHRYGAAPDEAAPGPIWLGEEPR